MSSTREVQPFNGGLKNKVVASKGIPRPLEFVLSALALVVLSPVLLCCAILVLLSSQGPVVFRQLRVGRNGKTFRMFKFRTMRVTACGPLITAATDNRITPVGRFLRKWKLDELPEIYNVLKGDMSFVGPRPEVPELVDLSNPAWQVVLSHRPGITDPVTLTLRDEEAVLAMAEDKELYYTQTIQPYKLRGYLKYLEGKSFRRDCGLILRTLRVIVTPRNEGRLRELADISTSE